MVLLGSPWSGCELRVRDRRSRSTPLKVNGEPIERMDIEDQHPSELSTGTSMNSATKMNPEDLGIFGYQQAKASIAPPHPILSKYFSSRYASHTVPRSFYR